MNTVNPVAAWREAKGLTRRETAIMTHLNYSQIAAAELGLVSRLPRALLNAITMLDGSDTATSMEISYHTWRTIQAQTVTQQLAHS